MANIVYISKYPPLEGGIASKTYWLSNALARSGHTVHVVTDAVAIDTHLSISGASQPHATTGVFVHRADQAIPWHIPNDSHRSISLLDKALEVVTDNAPDVVIGGYLVPYGIVSYQISRLTGLPFVLMHGGSDINKFLLCNVWDHLLQKTLSEAAYTITDLDHERYIRQYTDKAIVLPPYVPDSSDFCGTNREIPERLTLALIGKANYYWQHKGWQKAAALWDRIGDEFKCIVVSQGIGLKSFKTSIPKRLADRIEWAPFVPPWDMPKLLQTIDCLISFQEHVPFAMYSNIVLEALACGVNIIADTQDIPNCYLRYGFDFDTAKNHFIPISQFFSSSVVKGKSATKLIFQERGTMWDCSQAFSRYYHDLEQAILKPLFIA